MLFEFLSREEECSMVLSMVCMHDLSIITIYLPLGYAQSRGNKIILVLEVYECITIVLYLMFSFAI